MENFQERGVQIRFQISQDPDPVFKFLKGWIRIRFVLRGLDPDPVNIRPDPKPCLRTLKYSQKDKIKSSYPILYILSKI